MTKWLVAKTQSVQGGKREHQILERPLLHARCNEDHFGDTNIDIRPEVNPDVVCDVTEELPHLHLPSCKFIYIHNGANRLSYLVPGS